MYRCSKLVSVCNINLNIYCTYTYYIERHHATVIQWFENNNSKKSYSVGLFNIFIRDSSLKSRKYDLHFPKVISNVIPLVIHYPAKIVRAGFNDYEKPGQDLYTPPYSFEARLGAPERCTVVYPIVLRRGDQFLMFFGVVEIDDDGENNAHSMRKIFLELAG